MPDIIEESFVGIDVAKSWLDVGCLATGSTERLNHDEAGIAGLCKRSRAQMPTLVVMEATGGVETALARACGRLAKTDKIDALILAAFAQAIR